MSIRSDFFDALVNGAKWDVGVSINRTNPVPLDEKSVFQSKADLDTYAAGALSYPGQVVAVVTETATTIYYLDQNKVAKEVGIIPKGDGKSIEVDGDVISILGADEAGALTLPRMKADKSGIEWVTVEAIGAENTVTSGDNVTVVTVAEVDAEGNETGNLIASLKGQDDAATDTVLRKHVAEDGTESYTWDAVYDKDAVDGLVEAVDGDLDDHIADKNNPHAVTAAQVGLGNVTNDAQVKRSEMGVAGGVATLDENGLVPASQLPSYVDDVIEVANYEALPEAGEEGKIYVDLATGKTYRWGGSAYAEISASIALGETAGTAYEGSKGKALADKVAVLEGADTEAGSVANSIKTAIEALDVEDEAVAKQFVTAVSEADGMISVSRAALTADDIPTVAIGKVDGLQDALDAKATNDTVNGIDERLEAAEGTIEGLGTLATKSEVTKSELGADLKAEIEGKLDASAVTGDLLTHNAAEFATAAQGGKADSAIQTVKVNGNSVVNGTEASITIKEGTTNGTISDGTQDIPVHGLGSAAYTESSAYAEAGHNHDEAYAAKAATEAHIANGDIHVTTDDKSKWNTAATKADTAEADIATLNGDGAGSVTKKINDTITGLNLPETYAAKSIETVANSALQTVSILGKDLAKSGETVVTVADAKTALGLKSAAYEEASAFATAGHNHDEAYAAKAATEDHIADGDIHVTAEKKAAWDKAVEDVNELIGEGTTGSVDSKIEAAIDELAAVAKSGAAADVSIADAEGVIVATTVEAALTEIAKDVDALETSSAITIDSSATTEGALKSYTLKQGEKTIGTIDIPKDLVAVSGSVIEVTDENKATYGLEEVGTYMEIEIANGDPFYVNVSGLIEYVKNGETDEISVTIDENYAVKAEIKSGSIAKTKLATAVQESLGLADSALQKADIATGSANGTISVEGTDVAVKGLADAAYTTVADLNATAQGYADGAAGTAVETVVGTANDTSATDTIKGTKKYADEAAASALTAAKKADEKVRLAKVTASNAGDTEERGNICVSIPITSGYSLEDYFVKVIINGVVYCDVELDEAANLAYITVDFSVDENDDVYVEWKEKLAS